MIGFVLFFVHLKMTKVSHDQNKYIYSFTIVIYYIFFSVIFVDYTVFKKLSSKPKVICQIKCWLNTICYWNIIRVDVIRVHLLHICLYTRLCNWSSKKLIKYVVRLVHYALLYKNGLSSTWQRIRFKLQSGCWCKYINC